MTDFNGLCLVAFWDFGNFVPLMKKGLLISLLVLFLLADLPQAEAQCSICTKTAQQLGEKPAKGMNGGILYLAFAPFLIVGYISYRFYKGNKVA